MENQTRCDLEQALRAWREDCASRPGISFDNARELESDLRERVGDLRKQGLNEMEAFREAVRQVGSPGELAAEFAREHPLAVWRERLFWIVAAGFGVSVWHLWSAGPLFWFINNLGALLPLPAPAWLSLGGNLPLLGLAVLLAQGRLPKLEPRLRFFGRRHLALAGLCLLAAGLLVRLFGPSPLISGESLGVKVIALSTWPLLLLFLDVGLFRPARAPESTEPGLGHLRLPPVVWRERVFWMAVGGLAVGTWRTVSWVGMNALFYTGEINRPFSFGPLFLATDLLFSLSPLIVLGLLLWRRMRAGKDVTAGRLIRRRALFTFIPVVVIAQAVMHLWTQHYWNPFGFGLSWSSIVANYFTTLPWLWPAGLALLILWLAPRSESQISRSVATALD